MCHVARVSVTFVQAIGCRIKTFHVIEHIPIGDSHPRTASDYLTCCVFLFFFFMSEFLIVVWVLAMICALIQWLCNLLHCCIFVAVVALLH